MGDAIYASNPAAASDAGFVDGTLGHAVVGNRGRLLDARRTPVSITAVIPERGELEVRVDAFEDRGARWRLPVWEIARLQFDSGAAQASRPPLARLERAVSEFARELVIDADAPALAVTRRRIEEQRAAVREHLGELASAVDLAGCVARRHGERRLFEALERFLDERDLLDLDRRFCEAMVSNPRAGELVKGHAIMLAELGLCTFRGTVVRDPALFDADASRARRSEHLIARLAFSRALWDTLRQPLILYRAAAVDGPLPARGPASLVSCTFSHPVAAAHFAGGPTTRTAVMWRQTVAPERLLMTFLETRAMNRRFAEAEAVLVGDPENLAF